MTAPSAFALVACAADSSNQVDRPVSVAMTRRTTAYYNDGNAVLYQVQTPVSFPVKRPSAAESQGLGPAPAGTPYPHAPYLRAEDERIEVQYVLSNIDETSHDVWLLIDPWNEFVRYHPGITVNGDVTVPNFGYDLGFSLPPKSRTQGTLTPDDIHEIAIKLAATEKLLLATSAAMTATQSTDNSLSTTALANHLFDPANRSNGSDPLFTPWIPPVVAGLTGFDLGLRTSEAANVAVQVIVTVQDLNGNRFVAQDSATAQLGIPSTILSPPAARF